MLDDVLAIPDHLRDALWRVESGRLEPTPAAGLMVCGMGGSAIGGDLAAAALGDTLTGPLVTVRGYALPSWATPEWTILCSSYSGDTEETLACFDAAEALGARRIVASTGGSLVESAREAGVPVIGLPGLLPAPRTAVAYMLVCAAEVAALAGIAPRIHTEIDAAASFLAERGEELQRRAGELAVRLEGSVPVVVGADLTAPVARRWKTQVNENAKLPAFAHELPELDHNEIVGWEGAQDVGRFSAVFLDDSDAHPRVKARMDLTERSIAANALASFRLETRGETTIERVISLVLLGDLVSIYLAALRGVDPGPVKAIDELKAALEQR